MSYRLPSPHRKGFSTQGQFRNPAVSNPLPLPEDMPAGCWFGGKIQLGFVPYAGPEGYNRQSAWSSPIFDLQPQLRGFYPQGSSGGANNTKRFNAIPIWRDYQSGTPQRLHVQIVGLSTTPASILNMIVLSQEFGHVSDSGQVQAVTAQGDITSQLITGDAGFQTNSVILNFSPYGEESPIRFWQLHLRIVMDKLTVPATPDPRYTIEGAYY
jgi:hypothetical protein